MLESFIINLLSSAIWAVITIFTIDKLMQKREEKRFLPAKQVAYAKIAEVALEIQFYLTVPNERDSRPLVIFFGQNDAIPDYQRKFDVKD